MTTENKRKTYCGEDRAEPEGSLRGYSYLDIEDGNFVSVYAELGTLEEIIDPGNLNRAYKRVRLNKGAAGVDKMSVEGLLEYLKSHGEELRASLKGGRYKPNPVRRVEIPKDNGKTRPLGIPTAIDRMVQQAIAQMLMRIYEPTFSGVKVKMVSEKASYAFRTPRKGQNGVCAQIENSDLCTSA